MLSYIDIVQQTLDIDKFSGQHYKGIAYYLLFSGCSSGVSSLGLVNFAKNCLFLINLVPILLWAR